MFLSIVIAAVFAAGIVVGRLLRFAERPPWQGGFFERIRDAAPVTGHGLDIGANDANDANDAAAGQFGGREERFRLLLESVTDYAIVMLDPAGLVISWNEGAQRILGYTEEEVIGRSAGIFAPPEESGTLPADLAAAAANGRLERDVISVRKDGSRFAASVTVTPMVDEAQSLRGFAVVTHDITERVQLEQTRQELVTGLRDVAGEWTGTFDAVQVPIVLIDDDGEIRRLNRAALDLAHGAFTEVINKRAAELDGEPWPTIARLARETLRSGLRRSERAAAGDQVWQVSSCVSGSDPSSRRAIVAAYDLTVVTRLEASVRDNEVAAAMGTMVAAVAHEVRNPLFAISAIVDASAALYGHNEGVARYAAPLRDQVDRLNRLMSDLLEYGKPNPLNVRAASLGDAIQAARADCAASAAQARTAVVVDIEPDLPRAEIDPLRIEQVLQNVIDNAIRHSPAGGTVLVEARLDKGGDFVCRVIDEGPGMAAGELERAFLPFFTRRRGGTGLGLAIARKIVVAHGGRIDLVNREDGGGAIVTIRLPRRRDLSDIAPEARAKAC